MEYRGRHISAWKLADYLVSNLGGKKTYESVSYNDKMERRSAYCYLNKVKAFVRISDHVNTANEKRAYSIEVIVSYFNLDFTINGRFIPQMECENKSDVSKKILQCIIEMS